MCIRGYIYRSPPPACQYTGGSPPPPPSPPREERRRGSAARDGYRASTEPLLKDWVLTTKEFLEQVPNMIQEVILDHDKHFR
jgi:hypothetical protein